MLGDLNTYVYVSADPITGLDWNGLRREDEGAGRGGGFGVGGPRPIRFPGVKEHALRHGEGKTPGEYLQDAMNNIQRGRPFNYRHDGEQKLCYISRTGPDNFKFTSTNYEGTLIRTHMEVTMQYLQNIGITLPKGF